MNARLTPEHEALAVAPLRVAYQSEPMAQTLTRIDALAAIAFHTRDPVPEDPRALHLALAGGQAPPLEVWQAEGPVRAGRSGRVRHAASADWQFCALELDEAAFDGDIAATTEAAYSELAQFQQHSGHRHLIRIWNYLDAITQGEGDAERYRQFCIGRARGLGARDDCFPAATAIGRRDGRRSLQVYWLSSRVPGLSIENPRQVSAFRYPRCYGPQPPSFSRGCVVAAAGGAQLFISGTAAVVGHESRHPGRLREQLLETVGNLEALLAAAAQRHPELGDRFGTGTILKVYLREPEATQEAEALLRERLPAGVALLLLEADICRADLLIEIDGIHRGVA
ncbi:MAG TPA: pteridine-dependent deoxygenase [Xanthomonadaceae bacterium]|nr:pteridine-dependent deoxygenase [Xanthomonadaceae bacterium]